MVGCGVSIFAPPVRVTYQPRELRESSHAPHTTWNDLRSCGEYFDEMQEYKNSRTCTYSSLLHNEKLTAIIDPPLPRCYVIGANSKDVVYSHGASANVIMRIDFPSFSVVEILGFYDSDTSTIYIVENFDIDRIYRHEIQHYIIDTVYPGFKDLDHSSSVWSNCEPKTYGPTTKQIESNKYIRPIE
jgi:hypothetical protein